MPEQIMSMLEDHFVTIRNKKDFSICSINRFC